MFSRDTKKRKEKRVLPRSSAESNSVIWGIEAYNKVSDILNPIALKHFSKSNLRSLNKNELKELDNLKLSVFSNLTPLQELDDDSVQNILKSKAKTSRAFYDLVQNKLKDFEDLNKRSPNSSESKLIYAFSLAESCSEKTP